VEETVGSIIVSSSSSQSTECQLRLLCDRFNSIQHWVDNVRILQPHTPALLRITSSFAPLALLFFYASALPTPSGRSFTLNSANSQPETGSSKAKIHTDAQQTNDGEK